MRAVKLAVIAAVVAAAFLLGLRTGRRTARIVPGLKVVWDTTEVVRFDTITRYRPVFVRQYVHDTVRTYFTTVERDTVLVDVPIERKVYEEDSLYRAVVSGWRPSLDSLTIFPTTTTITIRETVPARDKARWGIGVQGGVGACKDGLTPYVGVGVSWNILSW